MADQDDSKILQVEKTYNQILAKKEAKLSREALSEKRATQLTKYFIRERENDLKAQLDAQADRSRKNYERSMKKVLGAGEAAAAEVAMVREEKSVIAEHMAFMGRRRQEEELQAKREKEEREKWQQERERKKLAERQERMDKHEQAVKENKELQDQEKAAAQQKRLADAEKASERKKKLLKEVREAARHTIDTVDRKLQGAEQRRQEQIKKASDAYREHVERAVQKAEDCERRREELRQEKQKKLVDKALQFEARFRGPRSQQAEMQEDDASVDGSKDDGERGHKKSGETSKAARKENRTFAQTAPGQQDAQAASGEKKDKAEDKKQEEHGPASPRICYDSRELIDANNRAHKDYVRRNADLQQAGQRMMTNKKFKTLADAAASKEDSTEDPASARLRSLHKAYIAQEGKGRGGGHGESTTSGSATARTPRKELNRDTKRTCGLCEREFLFENLTGSAKHGTLQKLKNSPVGMHLHSSGRTRRLVLGHQDSGHALHQTLIGQASERSLADASNASEKAKNIPGVRLYDTDVPLCAACSYRVRIEAVDTL
eukprot:TRINITY_DN10522_c0_g1_i1.p1 TRINITY_DN10522_c0_g1~~TRINITY_DN10522_c0_g1_i1.p1  ORF type:complete len:560 (-),score=153.77 TRINITY_DN10522_c0_g1_i1:133-1779(-)